MSRFFVECTEPAARPMRRILEVAEGAEFAVYVAPGAPGLRRTVLRGADDHPPAGARFVCSLRVDAGVLSVVDTSASVTLELLRSGARSRVVGGVRVPAGAPLELVLPDDERVAWSIGVRRTFDRGAAAGVSGSGTRRSRVRYGTDNPWWILLDGPDLLIGLTKKAWDQGRDRLAKLGFDGRVATMVAGFVLSGVLFGWVAFSQWSAAGAATEWADGAESALARAEAAQAAALQTELACLAQREELVASLGEVEQARRVAAERALQLTASRTAALQGGGAAIAAPEAVAIDQLRVTPLVDAVVARLGQAEGDPAPCLAQEAALGKDLPRYLLTWHPDAPRTCPADYRSGDGGIAKAGRFGLSDRVARDFGPAGDFGTGGGTDALVDLLGDPRHEDRWSAFSAASGLRATVRTLLGARGLTRPAVAASEAHLWSLALLDAYNRMPSPAEGVLDEDLPTCVEALLLELAARPSPPVPGEPVLPDLVSVADGRFRVVPTPTPGCPWPADAVQLGADAALRAAARLADHDRAEAPAE
jgi:hypothetical protein